MFRKQAAPDADLFFVCKRLDNIGRPGLNIVHRDRILADAGLKIWVPLRGFPTEDAARAYRLGLQEAKIMLGCDQPGLCPPVALWCQQPKDP